jgi:hypothetical protein
MIDSNWTKYEYDFREYRAALKAGRDERFMAMLAEAIANNARHKNGPRPSKDLF